MKAIWNGEVIAESENTIVIEGNHYFPENSLNKEFYTSCDTSTVCHWKGTASYYTLDVKGQQNVDAAWHYPEASAMAKSIEGHTAFWKGAEITN